MTIKKLKSIDIINVLSDLVSEKLETTVKLPSLDTLCSLYYEIHNQLMDIIHTHNEEENYKVITAKRAMIEGTIMTKVMQEHGYSLDQYAYYKNDKMVA